MKLSVVIPVHNGGERFGQSLVALGASVRVTDELIVVDDASSDNSAVRAQQAGARIVRLAGTPRGPAYARNRGAEQACGDVLVFLDADVAVHPDTLGRIEYYLTTHPEDSALFGSYDDNPPAKSTVSLYKNLQHHWVHQHAKREACTFWAGCGAVRREAFRAVGGFDEGFAHPSIEDIELGLRLYRAGARVRVCPDVQVTHLKAWTLTGLVHSDIFDRAVPWSRLILRDGEMPSDLNLDVKSRVSAIVAWLGVALLLVGALAPVFFIALPVLVIALLLANLGLYRFFALRGGLAFAVRATGLHWLYLLYSSAVFGSLWAARLVARFHLARWQGWGIISGV